MSSTYDAHSITEIKKIIVQIIAAFRGLVLLADNEVKLEELTKVNGNQYLIKGKYHYTSLFGSRVEEGSFEVTLNEKLSPISSRVISKNSQQ